MGIIKHHINIHVRINSCRQSRQATHNMPRKVSQYQNEFNQRRNITISDNLQVTIWRGIDIKFTQILYTMSKGIIEYYNSGLKNVMNS